MEEKHMINDVLQNSKDFVILLDNTILESNNIEFRQMITTLRNTAESFDCEIRKIAESKGYYIPSLKVEESEIAFVRKLFL